MVTKRLDVDSKRVNWFDGQRVTRDELRDEQNRNINIDAANVANFFGSGIVRYDPTTRVILNTSDLNALQQSFLDGYSFDGQNVYVGSPLPDVSDTIQGVNLAVTLSNVNLDGAQTTRIVIFGIEFGNNLIADELTFHNNCTQITRGRYKEIRGVVFNNFAGNLHGGARPALDDGYNLIGNCVIREAESMEVSIDPIVASQTKQPDVFLSNFTTADLSKSVTEMFQEAIGDDHSFSELGIGLSSVSQRTLSPNDVTTKIGQKFLMNGSNIQKISILLSVQKDNSVPIEDAYNWSGSMQLTLRALQTEVECPVNETPDNAVDFDPDPGIIAVLALSKEDMSKRGIVLGATPQIVDFVFTDTKIASPSTSTIETGQYYSIDVSRIGDASVGTILLEEAAHVSTYGYMIVFDGSQWINVRESDMWYSIEGDYVKISNGIAYVNGIGVEVPKIKQDSTNTEVPFVQGFVEFTTVSQDAYNYTLLEQQIEYSDPEQDQRTGNLVYSRSAAAPSFSMITQSEVNTLVRSEPAPLFLARSYDCNPRGNTNEILGTLQMPGLGYNNKMHIIVPDADVLNNNLVNSILSPNTSSSFQYRIISAILHNDAYGDINGDGVVDINDLAIINSWISDGYNFDRSTNVGQQQIIDGYALIDQILRADVNGDGKVDATDLTLITDYINKRISTFPAGSTFSRMELQLENLVNPLTTSVSIQTADVQFRIVPFSLITWKIDYISSWIPDLLGIEDLRRNVPTTFTESYSPSLPNGRNDFYIPGNLIIDGYQVNPNGTFYSIDFEMCHVVLNIPVIDSYGNPTFLDGYKGMLLFDNFVAESSDGKTASGFNAMKYHDGTFVQFDDFIDGKVKIVPSIQSTANAYPVPLGGEIDDAVGLFYDPSTSLLTIYVHDLYNDGYGNTLLPKTMKISVVVYLKKSGFANQTRQISAEQVRELLSI